jgi:sulfur-carrier protein
MILNIQYYGMIAEMTKCENEKIDIPQSISLDAFKSDLIKKYPTLQNANYQIAVNQELVSANFQLEADCEIALLPPFAGG